MLLERLLDPVSTVIEAENQRISSRLATNMLDAEAHEEAALLLGALGLKEGYFYRFADLRQVLCRITTHLALASALRQGEPLGTVGQFANATLLVLLGRQVEAFAELDRLSEKHSPAARSWIKALLLYATTDWRLPPGEAESLLERLQRFRAMATTLGTSGAIDRMGPEVHGPLADWGRIVTASYTVSAGDGSFVRTQMGKEIAEIQEIRALVTGKPLAPGEFGEALNQPAERLVTAAGPRVIGWGTWAAYYQRNICGLLIVAEEVLRDALAMPDSAEIYEEEANWLFDELTMHPIVEVNRTRHLGSRAEDIEGMEDTVTLARRRPELITPDNWNYMADTATYMMLKWSLPRADQWFSEAVLRTTVFDADLRRVLLRRKAGDASIFESLRAIAPRHRVVVHVGIDRLKDRKADVDEMIRELGDRIEFDINAVGWIGGEASDRLEDSSPLREIMCEADANDCFGLGWVLVRTGRTEEAVAVFERAVREAPDRIHVCNNCWWLVNYYFDQGRQDEALELAEMVADVYCSVGLTTLAGLLERMEQFDEAETWYERNQERYDSDALASYPLLGFYYRMARVLDQEEYEDKLQRAMQPIFTSGLEALPRTPDAEPPQGGLLLDGDSPRLQAAGLRGADVIVGLDGYRVHSMEQYDAIRWFRPRVNDMKLRVWRQTRYMDLEVESFNRYFDVRARTYGSPGPSIYYR
jgi:tetratricopeptide (TPR) repeat protein